MRILSIDLPWGEAGKKAKYYGFATVDLSIPGGIITIWAQRLSNSTIRSELAEFRKSTGDFDLILVDQPIGGLHGINSKYRSVEMAFTNSTWAQSDSNNFQCPRFQPGALHAEAGLKLAEECRLLLGREGCVVLESFPQLNLPSLLEFARYSGISCAAVRSLKSHKESQGREAQDQLIQAFSLWTGRTVAFREPLDDFAGRADAVDALIALLPVIEWAKPTPGMDEPWSKPVWLNAFDPNKIQLPALCRRGSRKAQRALWASSLTPGKMGEPGVRDDGLISMNLPGWLQPQACNRSL